MPGDTDCGSGSFRPKREEAEGLDAMERRLSTSSDASSSESSNVQNKGDPTMEFIPTRMTKVTAPKPAANPLQFVKVGPCDLFKSAQETLKKVEEVKKLKREVRDEAEEWQSNLDSWKCSRRKRVEHIIDRVVEVKKLELEEHERNRRKAKTFSEMMEERNSRGRKLSLLVHKDDSNDLSELGIGTSSDKSSASEDCRNDDNHSTGGCEYSSECHFVDEKRHSILDLNEEGSNGENESQDANLSPRAHRSSPEPDEYTYGRAIQGYVNFTETRAKSRNTDQTFTVNIEESEVTDCDLGEGENENPGKYVFVPNVKPKDDSSREGREISNSGCKQSKTCCDSSSDIDISAEKNVIVAKVNILKTRELFEKANESIDQNAFPKYASSTAEGLVNSKSIRDRVLNLEKSRSEKNEEKSMMQRSAGNVSVKDILSSIEKQKQFSGLPKPASGTLITSRTSSGVLITSPGSTREGLNRSENSFVQESNNCSNEVDSDSPFLLEIHSSELGSSKDRINKGNTNVRNSFANFGRSQAYINSQILCEKARLNLLDPLASSQSHFDTYCSKRSFHHSLDSLDVDFVSQTRKGVFERVQSLENVDSCGPSRNYPASTSSNENLVFSSQGGDTDREDSGIHTTDASCSVSQADDVLDVADINLLSCFSQLESEIAKTESERQLEDNGPPMIVSHFAKVPCSETSENSTKETMPKEKQDQEAHSKRISLPSSALASIPFSTKSASDNVEDVSGHDYLPVRSVDTSTDVSSLLDQALFEEDLKEAQTTKFSILPTLCTRENQQSVYSTDTSEVTPLELQGERGNIFSTIPLAFSIDTPTKAEPPKEKPPPPPHDLSDDEDKVKSFNISTMKTPCGSNRTSSASLNLCRVDSTKRLKKEIRRKRSDFLGIEGSNDDSYLEQELKLAPPPDMTSLLQEERSLEQKLYRPNHPRHSESQQSCNQSERIYHQSQPHYSESEQSSNQGESRDSGVELDSHNHFTASNAYDAWDSKQTFVSPSDHFVHAHSQNTESYGNTISASEENEIVKKESEITDVLEREEKLRYGNNSIHSASSHQEVGEKLDEKLRELEEEKMQADWERAEDARRVAEENTARQNDERRIHQQQHKLLQQEEELREERSRLTHQHAELEKQRQMLVHKEDQHLVEHKRCWDQSPTTAAHLSLQDVSGTPQSFRSAPKCNASLNYRLSLPDLQQSETSAHSVVRGTTPHYRRPPPPIPPAKPLVAISQERCRMRNIQRPSLVDPRQHLHNPARISATVPTTSICTPDSQVMSRQTLHALSAAPRSKIIATDIWVRAKRKPESQRNNNRDHYQHWLIQEAEHRRITEQQQRNAASKKSLQSQPPQSLRLSAPTQIWSQNWQYEGQQLQHINQNHSVTRQAPHKYTHNQTSSQHYQQGVPTSQRQEKPLPDAIIQTLTKRVQNRVSLNETNRRLEASHVQETRPINEIVTNSMMGASVNHSHGNGSYAANSHEKMLSVSGKKKCSHCNEELGRGAAMIIESLCLFYHMDCFKCCVCHVQLGDGLMGTDVRVRNHKLHCHNCYSSDDGVKFSCV